MKTKHTHSFKKGRGNVDVCSCGKFRFNERAGEFIIATPATEHTQGQYKRVGYCVFGKKGRTEFVVADCRPNPASTMNGLNHTMPAHLAELEAVANANLFAAAPELLEALEKCFEKLKNTNVTCGHGDSGDGLSYDPGLRNLIVAAIAKARGEV